MALTLDQSQTSGGYGAGGKSQWQSFTTGFNGTLGKFEWNMLCPIFDGGRTSIEMKLYQGEGVTGNLLRTSIGLTSPPYGSNEWVEWDLSGGNIAVVAGDVYTVQLTTVNVTSGWLIMNEGSFYTRGISSSSNRDYLFKSYVILQPYQPIDKSDLQTAVDNWCKSSGDSTKDITSYGGRDINTWDTSLITDMSELFRGKTTFNDNIGSWDTSKVTKFRFMFRDTNFNQDINGWNVSSGSEFDGMFKANGSFSQNLNDWRFSTTTPAHVKLTGMFQESNFNGNISQWDTSGVIKMNFMFNGASAFNQDIGNWNTTSVTDMDNMFSNAMMFDRDIRYWNVASSVGLNNMFQGATAFSTAYSGSIGYGTTPLSTFFNKYFIAYGITYSYEDIYDGNGIITNNAKITGIISGSPTGDFVVPGGSTFTPTPITITEIGGQICKNNTNITSVTIPASITVIHRENFYGCTSLTSVIFDQGSAGSQCQVIGDDTFNGCIALTSMNLPYSIYHISPTVFQNTGLQTVYMSAATATALGGTGTSATVPSTNVSFRGATGVNLVLSLIIGPGTAGSTFTKQVWFDAGGPLDVEIRDYETIPNAEFSPFSQGGNVDSSTVTNVVLGSGVTTISATPFWYTSDLISVTLGPDIANITGGFVGKSPNLTTLLLDANNTVFHLDNGILYKKDGSNNTHTMIQYPLGRPAEVLTIPSSTVVISDTFAYNSNISSIVFGNNSSVQTIGINSFSESANLTNIRIPDSVTSIGVSAFCDSGTNLTNISLPGGATIDNRAFEDIGNGTNDVTVEVRGLYTSGTYDATAVNDVLTTWNNQSQFTVTGTGTLNFIVEPLVFTYTIITGSDVSITGSNYGTSLSGILTIPSTIVDGTTTYTVTKIGDEAFNQHSQLTSVIIPTTVTTIGVKAFQQTLLTTLTFNEPSHCSFISAVAFEGIRISTLVIPASVTEIGNGAFENNANLTDASFDNGSLCTTIGWSTFANTQITTFIIPPNVITIGNQSFESTYLTNITIPESVTSIGANVFNTITGNDETNPLTVILPSNNGLDPQLASPSNDIVEFRGAKVIFLSGMGTPTATFPGGTDGGPTNNNQVTVSGLNAISATKLQYSTNAGTSFTEVTLNGVDDIYTFTIPDGGYNANGNIQIIAIDAAENESTTISNTTAFTVDTVEPIINHTNVVATINDRGTALGSVSANETVMWSISAGTGVNITNHSVLTVPIPFGGTSTVTIPGGIITLSTPADHQTASSHTFTVKAVDVVGHESTVTKTVTVIDTTPPTVSSFTIDNTALKIDEHATVTLTFSEAVTEFSSNTDIIAQNGTLPEMTTIDSVTWTGTFTPNTNVTNASNVLTLSTNYIDLAGNSGPSATSANYAIDTTPPTVSSFTISDTALKIGETATVTLTFSEAVTEFSSNTDIIAQNGTLPEMTTIDSVTWTGTFTPNTNVTNASNVLTLSTNYIDLAGNSGPSATSANYTIDTTPPTVSSFTISGTALKIGETASVTLTFSEAVTEFSKTNITAPNGTLSDMTSNNNITWTGTFTPNTNVEDVSNELSLSTNYTDLAGNSGPSATAIPVYAIDTLAPTINAIGTSDFSWGAILNSLERVNDQTVSVTTSGVENGQIVTITLNGVDYTNTITNNASIVTISTVGLQALNIGQTYTCNASVSDAAGNVSSTVTSSEFSIDTAVITVESFTMSSVELNMYSTPSVTLRFSKEIPNFSSNTHITAMNGTLSLMVSSDNLTWSGTFTPATNNNTSENVLTLDDTYTDIADNIGPSATTVFYTIDTVPPEPPTIGFPTSSPTNDATITVTLPSGAASWQYTLNGTDASPTWYYANGDIVPA